MTDQFVDANKMVPESSMTDLSPAAQAVLDATISRWPRTRGWIVAAALRAAADQLQFADDYGTRLINADDLLAIAAELEGKANHND